MKQNIDTIIFDAGGVLLYINEFRPVIMKRVLTSRGFKEDLIDNALIDLQQFDSEYFTTQRIVDWNDEKKWLLERASRMATFVGGDETLAEQLYHTAFDTHEYKLYSETIEVLERLKKRYRLFVLSNATATLDWAFDNLGIRPYFEQVMVSSYERCEKPDLEIFKRAITAFSIDPASTLFIDDKIENVIAAKECAIQSYHLQRSKGQSLLNLEHLLTTS